MDKDLIDNVYSILDILSMREFVILDSCNAFSLSQMGNDKNVSMDFVMVSYQTNRGNFFITKMTLFILTKTSVKGHELVGLLMEIYINK